MKKYLKYFYIFLFFIIIFKTKAYANKITYNICSYENKLNLLLNTNKIKNTILIKTNSNTQLKGAKNMKNNKKENKNPIVTIEMENGDKMKIELYPNIAPNTVNNFISLIKKDFYNNLIFHRVIKDFMIQGGCPEGTGFGGPDYYIKGEFLSNNFENKLKHTKGVISMARSSDKNSAGSQFFIVHKDSPHLDGEYASFGKIVEGIEILDKIATTETDYNDKPIKEQIIKSITVDTFGINYNNLETIKK